MSGSPENVDAFPTVNTASDFIRWCSFARPLDFCVYHCGELGAESMYDNEIATLADAVQGFYRKGRVRLFQKRIGKTPEPDRAGAMLYLAQKVRS